MKMRLLVLSWMLFWSVSCHAQTGNAGQYKYVFTVAKDGSGDYTTIQAAINAMRVYPLAPITLYIKNGVYNEKVELPATNTDVSFLGQSADSTIITWNDYAGKAGHTTFTSYTAKISGNRFRAENITFVNSAGAVGQALALYVDADKAVFKNCRFIGNQDTIFAAGETARQYFVGCYIEGTTDFIFGPATAVFDSCIIRAKAASYITAASTTQGKRFGFVLMNCLVQADSSISKLYLGRPWRAYAAVTFLQCRLPAAIAPAGWDNWGNTANEQTARFAEYRCSGTGAATALRVKWARHLSRREVKRYALSNIFSDGQQVGRSDGWYNRQTDKPFNQSVFKIKTPGQ